MSFVYFARRGTEHVFRIGYADNLPDKMKEQSTPDRRVIETDEPATCEAFLHNYYGSRRIDGTKELFRFAPEEIGDAVKVANGFVSRFLPAKKTVEQLCEQPSDGKVVSATDRAREIYRRLRELREEEYRIARRRELLEYELKAIVGTADGLQGLALWKSHPQSRFDLTQFKSDHHDLYQGYVRQKLVRRFQLL